MQYIDMLRYSSYFGCDDVFELIAKTTSANRFFFVGMDSILYIALWSKNKGTCDENDRNVATVGIEESPGRLCSLIRSTSPRWKLAALTAALIRGNDRSDPSMWEFLLPWFRSSEESAAQLCSALNRIEWFVTPSLIIFFFFRFKIIISWLEPK